jgi:hypothetical protein
MEKKADNQNSKRCQVHLGTAGAASLAGNGQAHMLDSSIGLTITTLYLQCKDCDHVFYRSVVGIVLRVSGKLVISSRDKPDRPFKVGKCLKCGSREIYHVEFL